MTSPLDGIRWLQQQRASQLRRAVWVGCAVMAALLAMADAMVSNTEIIQQFGATVAQEFRAEVQRQEHAERDGRLPEPQERNVRLVYGRTSKKLLSWSSNAYVPRAEAIDPVLAAGKPLLLQEENVTSYALPFVSDTQVVVRLIPLRMSYPFQNEFLHDYLYLGQASEEDWALQLTSSRYFSLLPTRQGINYQDGLGQHLCSLRITEAAPLRRSQRLWVLALASVALLMGFAELRNWLRTRLTRSSTQELWFISALVLTRLGLLFLQLPGSYVPMELFSPRLLALDVLSPSLGDLLLNGMLISYVSFRLGRLYDHPTLARKWASYFVSGKDAWLVLHLLAGIAAVLIYVFFVDLIGRVASDSTLYFQFTDLTRIDGYVLVLFGALALITAAIFYFLYWLAGLITAIDDSTEVAWHWQWVGTAIAAALLVLISGHPEDALMYTFLKHGLLFLRRRYHGGLDFDLAAAFLVVAGLASVTSLSLARADDRVLERQLVQSTQRYADPRDLITEYLFDEVSEHIAADASLWTTDSIFADSGRIESPTDELVARVVDNHLDASFRGYAFTLFFFDASGRRLDHPSVERNPYVGLTLQRMRSGATLSSKLFLVPDGRSFTGFGYIGRFTVLSPVYGRVYVQVELLPKATKSTKLYPLMLVDRSVTQRMELPQRITVGFYQRGSLVRKEGMGELPVLSASSEAGDSAGTLTHSLNAILLTKQMPDGTVLLGQGQRLGALDRLTSFSLVTYFYLLLYSLTRLWASVKPYLRTNPLSWRGSYVRQIQFVLGAFAFVPLLAMWALTSPLFTRMYYEEAEAELKRDLRLVTEHLQNEPYFNLNINTEYVWRGSADAMKQVNALTSNDLNVYRLDGSLFATTRQVLYRSEVVSRYMNPTAYSQLQAAPAAEVVVTERIGSLGYRSAYRAIVDDSGNTVGYTNMPYLTRQGVLDAQVNRLSSYVVNLYVVLMLALLIAGIFISRGLTQPLRMLRQKLDATSLGFRNERLAWQSNDEIGAIIRSYNQMLVKLEASQLELARSERENAWREMARQVAHEIKNPLTPMRLSIQHLLRILDSGGQHEQRGMVERLSQTLLTQVDSLSSIATTFSTFATLPKESPEVLDLNNLVLQVQALYSQSAEAQVQVEVPDKHVNVWADRELLSRAVVNLVRNALQAVEEQYTQDEHQLEKNGDARAGQVTLRLQRVGALAVLAIEDNGTGISIEVRDKVFQPNFSTKTAGMGLGLAITRRLIENMSGTIDFESEPGIGTTFYVSLPLHEG
jgi:two-component system nitrogen regulation sensor histidine kinase NtrY